MRNKRQQQKGQNSLAARMNTHTAAPGQNQGGTAVPGQAQGYNFPSGVQDAGTQPRQAQPGQAQPFRTGQAEPGTGQGTDRYQEAALEADELKREWEEKKQEHRAALRTKAVTVILASACVYLVLLIYGVFVTDYEYIDSGTVEPQLMSVSDIKEKEDFEVILVEYESCRMIYEQILMLDYRVSQGEEEPLTISPLYTELLEGDVSTMLTQISGADVEAKYSELNNLMYAWLDEDTAQYLQYIAEAITEDDYDKLEAAYACQTGMYNDFSIITESVVTIGESIKGVDVSDTKSWTPEDYVDETINGS